MKIKIVTVIMLAALLIAGCGDNDKVPTGPLTQNDILLTVDGKDYTVDGNVEDYITALGEDYTYSEAISCAYDGLDKTFDYTEAGVTFYTRPDGNSDLVGEIFATDTSALTPRGVGVGSTREQVEAAYGAPQQRTSMLHGYEMQVTDVANSPTSVYFNFDKSGIVTAVGITAEQLIGE